jgi:hypothetical protein
MIVHVINKDKEQAEQNGLQIIPYAKEFNELFPDLEYGIGYYTGEAGPPHWGCKVGLYGRYVLSMSLKIRFDKTRTKITGFDDPEFFIMEIQRVYDDNGTAHVEVSENQKRFGKEEWMKIVENNGDLSSLGIPIIKDRPLPNFDWAWKTDTKPP